MLETLQPPLAIYSSVWLPLILERNTLLNYWFRFPLPLLIPLHFIVTVYFPEDLPCVTSVFFPRNNKIGLSRPFLIFFFLECDHSQHTSLWIFWTLSSFMTCSIENQTLQLKVYLHLPDFSHLAANILLTPHQFHLDSMMFLTGIQHKICSMPVLCSFPAMVSAKEGLDEISFCLDISLLWGCWTGSKQRLISGQSYIPVKDNHHHQKAITNLILKKYTKPIY